MKTNRTLAIGIATLVGVGAGSYGIVAATEADTPPAETESDTDTDTDEVEEQDPQLDGSIKFDEIDGESEDAEDARLKELATVTEADAAAAAVAAAADAGSGVIIETELGNENGSVLWEFEIELTDGSTVEVKIDAGNAKVLDIETDDDESDDADDADDVENESEHDGDDASDPDADND